MTRIKQHGSTLFIALLGALIAILVLKKTAPAQPSSQRKPISISVAPTPGDNYLIYRMWDDGLIDVRLASPMKTEAHDWPESDRMGISFQERWKILQYGD